MMSSVSASKMVYSVSRMTNRVSESCSISSLTEGEPGANRPLATRASIIARSWASSARSMSASRPSTYLNKLRHEAASMRPPVIVAPADPQAVVQAQTFGQGALPIATRSARFRPQVAIDQRLP